MTRDADVSSVPNPTPPKVPDVSTGASRGSDPGDGTRKVGPVKAGSRDGVAGGVGRETIVDRVAQVLRVRAGNVAIGCPMAQTHRRRRRQLPVS